MKTDVDQLDYLHPILQEILLNLERVFKVEFMNTSNWRPDGVHKHGRGWDISCSYDPLGKVIEDYINSGWIYDPARPTMKCCLYEDDPKHIHVQVHPATCRK